MLEELPARMDRLESQIVQLRDENRAEHSAIRQEIAGTGETLRQEMQSLHARQGTEMRVLFEEAISRIAAISEGRRKSRKQKG